jgi:hypothetical protein
MAAFVDDPVGLLPSDNGQKPPLAQGEIGYGPHFLDATHAVGTADRDGAFVP